MEIINAPKTQQERIWDYINVNPKSTSQEVSDALDIASSTTAAACSILHTNGLLFRDPIKEGSSYRYSVAVPSYFAPTKERAEPMEKDDVQFDIDSLTIREARALFKTLRKMFSEA